MSAAAPLLVVLRALGLGDFLSAVPAYRALARAYPEHRRILAAPQALHALVPLLGDSFFAAADVAPLAPLPESLRDADVVANLHGSGPQSHRVVVESGARRMLAFAHSAVPESASGPPWDPQEHETLRWCRLLEHYGIGADPRELALAVSQTVSRSADGAVLVHPGAASESRRWPIDRWTAVVRAITRSGERVLVTGSQAERPRAHAIVEGARSPRTRSVAGQTTLLELAALVARARCTISGDTGIAHLASAYRTPSIVLFGPTPPQQWGPPADARHRVVWTGRCGDPHARVVDAGLLAITVGDVLRVWQELREFSRARAESV